MCAFSYAWSLPVTWQRWKSHHSIRHIQKPHVHANCMALCLIELELLPIEVLHCGIRHFRLFAPVTFIDYTNLTRIPWRYTGFADMNSLCQGFRKLSSDRQTDTTEITCHAALVYNACATIIRLYKREIVNNYQ